MKSLIVTVLVAAAPALAATPEFERGGAVIGLQYGWGLWNLDRAKLASQVGDGEAGLIAADTQNGHSATLRLGYNILGHATVEGTITATGWDLANQTRGGGGFVTGGVHWHPLQIFAAARDRFYDPSLFVGFGYGIMGEQRGMDGFVWQWGGGVDFFPNRIIGIGPFFRSTELGFGSFYRDYDNRALAGNTLNLPRGSGGSFMQVGVTVTLRIAP